MEGQILDIKNHKRPPNAKNIIRKVFSKADCLACGLCCKQATRVGVPEWEPRGQELRRMAQTHFPEKIQEAPNGGFDIVDEKGCPFLVSGEGGADCSVYACRPAICLMFPFIPNELGVLDPKSGEQKAIEGIVLTTACPPVKELAEAGVQYVETSDLIGLEKREVEIFAPILGTAFLTLLDLMEQGIIPQELFIRAKNGLIFPIQ